MGLVYTCWGLRSLLSFYTLLLPSAPARILVDLPIRLRSPLYPFRVRLRNTFTIMHTGKIVDISRLLSKSCLRCVSVFLSYFRLFAVGSSTRAYSYNVSKHLLRFCKCNRTYCTRRFAMCISTRLNGLGALGMRHNYLLDT